MPTNDQNNPQNSDRREFLKTAAGIGFAAAVLPVTANTIQTDLSDLQELRTHINVAGVDVPVYMAKPNQPDNGANLPMILVVSEIFGLHEHIADVARRFAKQGYLAIAPELFIRQGNPAKYDNIPKLVAEVVSKAPDEQVFADLDACVAWGQKQGGDIHRLGIAGFCWGGRITWVYANHNPQVKAGLAWYGKLIPDANAPAHTQYPINQVAQLKTPILGLYGAQDAGISVASVEQMRAALALGYSHSHIHLYPNSGHAFYADYRPSFNAVDAADSWQRGINWLQQNGVK